MKAFCVILVLASLICFCRGASKEVCKCGWFYNQGHCYHFGTSAVNWYRAASICREQGGYLVKIGSSTENNFLKGIARLIGPKFHHARSHGFWIGASDTHSEGKWKWDIDQNAVGFRDFQRGQPDNYGGKEDCGHIWGQAQGYRWNDGSCHAKIYYICEANVYGKQPCTCKA